MFRRATRQQALNAFSALQRAENSSIVVHEVQIGKRRCLSVLFSEPKIPQYRPNRGFSRGRGLSVLFSEPKIPQSVSFNRKSSCPSRFQCSSASRKFLNSAIEPRQALRRAFSALQRAENSSIRRPTLVQRRPVAALSVLFSEPKIPQSPAPRAPQVADAAFSALQRAENSSIPTLAPASIHIPDCDDHASSFLSLPGASP